MMDDEPKIRVAILFQRFGPYHHARLNAASRLMSVWGVEACAMEGTYAWSKVEETGGFTKITLTDYYAGDRQWQRELQHKMWQALDEIKPQAVVIPGWIFVDALSALWWCARTNTPAVVMSESNAWDEPRTLWKEWLKGRFVKICAAGLAGGMSHVDYLVQLGLPRERVFLGYDIVDNEYFKTKTAVVRSRATACRQQHGLPKKYFLASARFVQKKNLFRLLQAYAEYREKAERLKIEAPKRENGNEKTGIWDLVLLGDGPLKPDLERLIAKLGLQAFIHLPGFKQYEELPTYFGLASAFVHASTTEQWGLVVNEAMASSLPVLVSNRCGCAQDLVKEGVNGFTFDPDNVGGLAEMMLRISDPQFPISDFGMASAQIISAWGPERFGNGLKAAVKQAIEAGRPPIHFMDSIILKALLRCKMQYKI